MLKQIKLVSRDTVTLHMSSNDNINCVDLDTEDEAKFIIDNMR